ncbi:transcription initiation factor IID, 18kD subunit-domain-containing protein [Entophlyctis helioformis]|nr:transcription initiation factor IID, 18kD subunit-domain-containing protein [Entophlyctis helioformis]
MFVFGEVSEPLEETAILIEEIVRTQMIETMLQSVAQAAKRGSKYLAGEDLIFLIRHDRAKVNRLRTFLSWKDVRKNVKDNQKDSGGMEEDLMEEQASGAWAATSVWSLGPTDKTAKIRKMKVKFSWDPLTVFNSILDDDDDDEADDEERQAYEDEAARLRAADDVTRTMTKDEYIYYSECRQASFTYKKAKRFREWCEMQKHYDTKANSDVIDIMGFLAYEMVSRITETALAVKRDWDAEEEAEEMMLNRGTSVQMEGSLFDKPSDRQSPLQPAHIHEAYRRLQAAPQLLGTFREGLPRGRLLLM